MKTKAHYVAFTNPGEIDINAFKLLGASNKRNDSSKIGFFGTGLKYALAVLLRENVPFYIYSGVNEVKVSTKPEKFLDQEVHVMTINGEKTSITIDAGIDWEGWFAIREIYSNALDEGGSIGAEAIKPEPGNTKIYIDAETGKLGDVFSHWQRYFSGERKALYETTEGRILSKLPGSQNLSIYRKGILAYHKPDRSLFDYDLNRLELNESRVAKYDWQALENSGDLLAKCKNSKILQTLFDLIKDNQRGEYMEWRNEFWDYVNLYDGTWLLLIGGRELVPYDKAGFYEIGSNHLILPSRLVTKLRAFFGKQIKIAGEDQAYITFEDQDGVKQVYKSLDRLAKIGYRFTGEILIVDFKDKQVMGAYEDGKILISHSALNLGESDLDLVVLEEVIHHDTGFNDLTREFQTYCLREILRLARQKQKRANNSNDILPF